MGLNAEVTLDCFDGAYTFALKGKQIEELQKLCSAGFGEIGQRVMSGSWYYGDVYHLVRLGLWGGGTSPVDAKRLADTYVDGCPLVGEGDPSAPVSIAQAVVMAAYFGLEDVADEPPEKPQAGVTGE